MRNRKAITAIIMVLCLSIAVQAKYSGGTGEPNDPYLIETAEDMNAIGADSNDWDAHFLLVADINLADYTGTQFNIIGYCEDWHSPNNAPFTGVFDGNSHTISNFTYTTTDTDYIGLFGYIDSYIDGPQAEIKDLTLTNPNVNATGNSGYVGCLIGWLENGTITGCGIEGGSVSGYSDIGGLVGINVLLGGTISNCYATGSVTGEYRVGGLVGLNDGTISNCHATGSVTGDRTVGGLVGIGAGTITNCYSTGSVTGSSHVGGLMGHNVSLGGTISNCYATGSVSGYDNIGGLAGRNSGTISCSYATGNVFGFDNIGGLVGRNSDTISASFWDIETSGQTTSAGGTGLPTEQMQTESTFTDAGWDFIEIWNIGEHQTYPFLRTLPAGDINHDCFVNFYDLAILADHWLIDYSLTPPPAMPYEP